MGEAEASRAQAGGVLLARGLTGRRRSAPWPEATCTIWRLYVRLDQYKHVKMCTVPAKLERPIHYDFVNGRPSEVASELRRRVSAFTREDLNRKFKIGISCDPEGRWDDAYKEDYDEMIVLYQSSSIESVSEVERDLIAHNKHFTKNRIAGGGGGIGTPPFFLYLVLADK